MEHGQIPGLEVFVGAGFAPLAPFLLLEGAGGGLPAPLLAGAETFFLSLLLEVVLVLDFRLAADATLDPDCDGLDFYGSRIVIQRCVCV